MAYGIGNITAAMNQGYDQWRDRTRRQGIEDQQLEMQRQQFEAQQRANEQLYGIRAAQEGRAQDTHDFNETYIRPNERTVAEAQGAAAATQMEDAESLQRFRGALTRSQAGDISGLEEIFSEVFGPGRLEQTGQGYTFTNERGSKQFSQDQVLELYGMSDAEWIETVQQARQARAQAAAAEAEFQQDLVGRGVNAGTLQVQIGDDGQPTVMNAPEDEMGNRANLTALERNTLHYQRYFDMDPQTATMAAEGRLRPEEARREARNVASRVIDPGNPHTLQTFLRFNAETAAELGITENTEHLQALQILQGHFEKTFSSQSMGAYGVPRQEAPRQGPTSPPDPLAGVVRGASQQISRERRERELQEAEMLAQRNPADVPLLAGMLVEDGVMTDEEAQEWQRKHGRNRRRTDSAPGLLNNPIEHWQQR